MALANVIREAASSPCNWHKNKKDKGIAQKVVIERREKLRPEQRRKPFRYHQMATHTGELFFYIFAKRTNCHQGLFPPTGFKDNQDEKG